MNKKILILVFVVGGITIYFLALKPDEVSPLTVNSFEECVSAGNSILESYPRQCRTPDGISFTEDIGNELEKINLIRIDSPRPNQTISSPISIKGEARGYWFFEATFPIKLIDNNGEVIAQHYAQTKSEWMIEDFVPFEAELDFEIGNTQKGTLILEKSNPSDLPENYDELRMPVVLEKTEKSLQTIKLYYYNPDLDKDETGNVLCSRKGLIAVERKIPVTKTPIQDAIKLLLLGDITNEEKAQGITTEYPLPGFSLKGASLKEGSLTLEFDDSNNKTIGGSCRVGVLWFQVEATVKQFSQVREVKFIPEDIFQP